MRIHFIGIGGIGTSALAIYYLKKGNKISGSDLFVSESTESLKQLGTKMHIGLHRAKNVPSKTDLIIYSPAINQSNPELNRGRKLGIPIMSYPQALGELTKQYFTIAVSGTHGKSTTTAMIGLLLVRAGLDPTVIVGTKIKEFNNLNCRVGQSRYLVIEADEWNASFLNYWPKIVVLNNIEEEHLDYYKDLRHILKTYNDYVDHLAQGRLLIGNKDDKNVCRIMKKNRKSYPIRVLSYSLKQKEAKEIRQLLKIPGKHNVSNALGVLAVSRELNIPDKTYYKAIADYKGAWRRFEIKEICLNNKPGRNKERITLVSDYAHHPSEIKATISGARDKFKKRRIWVIFQPHQYQRTFHLFDDFVRAFDEANEVILTEIYGVAGRERTKISSHVSGATLALAVKKRGKSVSFVKDYKKIPDFLKPRLKDKDVVLVMGAGDIYKIVAEF